MKKLFIILTVFVVIASCSKKTTNISTISFLPPLQVVSIQQEIRILTIKDKSQGVVLKDTIIGAPIIVNAPPENIALTLSVDMIAKKQSNTKTVVVPSKHPTSYIVWVSSDFTINSRLWDINETISTTTISR